ncbi:MAG TPA: hypothetical protein VNM90_14470 [Haliangium sp.]|nr:hypothetical protein [Haliangium sp.]
MLRARHALPLMFLAALSLGADDAGCQSEASSDVNQDRIYTSYWVVYDAETDQTFARAQFRFGSGIGTTLELSDGAEVTFNGEVMPFNALLDWHEAIFAGRVEKGLFEYIDVAGNVYVNEVPVIDDAALGDVPDTLSADSSFSLVWEGTPLGSDEMIEILLAHDANRFDFARWEQRGVGTSSIVLSRDGLISVEPGNAVLQLRRWHDYKPAEAPEAGGKLTTTFHTTELPVILE